MWLFSPRKTRRLSSTVQPRPAFRPRLEALESRCLLSAGALDSTFGTGGEVLSHFLPSNPTGFAAVRAVTVYPATDSVNGGKILAAGVVSLPTTTTTHEDFAVWRYNADGTPDNTFGTGGMTTTDFAAGNDFAYAVGLDASGRIVVAGRVSIAHGTTTYTEFGVARYEPNGALDTALATGFGPLDATGLSRTGKVVTDFGVNAVARGLAIQPADGKIVVGGYSSTFALARYNVDGSLDPSFGTNGLVTTATLPQSLARAIALQVDGKIVLAGSAWNGADYDFAAARYNANGTPDTTFGTGGAVKTAVATATVTKGKPVSAYQLNDEAAGLAIDAQGRLVLAGFVQTTQYLAHESALVRYNANGSLDTTFNGTGKVVATFAVGEGRAVVVQPDGKIVMAGEAGGTNGSFDFGLARYLPSGALDSTFGSSGLVITAFTTGQDVAIGLALQPDGKIIAGGVAGSEMGLARYLGDAPAAPTNGTATAVSANQINLSWTETSTNVTGYYIERSTDGVHFTQIAAIDASSTTFSDTGLSPKTKYYYRLRAHNANGDSVNSAIFSALTPALG